MDRFIELKLGKEHLDGWTLGPAPGPSAQDGGLQRVRHKGPQLARLEVPAVTSLEGLLETSNLERKPRAKDWARDRDWGGGEQAEAGSGARPKLHCASLGSLETQEEGC